MEYDTKKLLHYDKIYGQQDCHKNRRKEIRLKTRGIRKHKECNKDKNKNKNKTQSTEKIMIISRDPDETFEYTIIHEPQ